MPDTTKTTTHVYMKVQDGQSLMPKYFGPLLIVDRPSHSTVTIKTGSWASGEDRLETHHWSNLRPAFVGPDTPLANRPKAGRPRQPPSTHQPLQIPEPTPFVYQPTEEEIPPPDVNSESPPNFENQDQTSDITDTYAEPTTVDDITPNPSPSTGPPPSPPFPRRSTRSNIGVPHPKYEDYSMWSANRQQLNAINYSISTPLVISQA